MAHCVAQVEPHSEQVLAHERRRDMIHRTKAESGCRFQWGMLAYLMLEQVQKPLVREDGKKAPIDMAPREMALTMVVEHNHVPKLMVEE